ncbi:MAG: helix-turn-helix transcriptional regulator [Pseudomonadota bacterium]
MNDFVMELRDVRHASGLTQKDCARLLSISEDQYCAIERGLRDPELKEIIGLSIMFGKSFESLFGHMMDDVRANMAACLESLPPANKKWVHRDIRRQTIARIEEFLHSLNPIAHAS